MDLDSRIAASIHYVLMRPYLIAIAGPSGSGKTELARRVAATLDAPILSLDSYYRDAAHLPFAERLRINFDDPAAIEHDLLLRQLAALTAGEEIEVPVYDFAQYVREPRTEPMRAQEFAMIEGLFALYWEDVRRLAGTTVFVDAPDEICLSRRMDRDIRERGRTVESVIEQYAGMVRPMADLYVRPARELADVVVSGCEPVELSAQAVLAHVAAKRAQAAH
jgi:uridine kinase